MATATIAAFAIGDFAEAVGIILFYRVGELFEEIGYRAEPEELSLIACLRRTNSFCSVYTLHIDQPEDAFILQKEEVSMVRWCDRSRIQRMISDNMLYNYGDAYFRMLFDYPQKKR